MASYLDKQKINSAIVDNTKLDLSHVHITTANFMQLQPIYNKEMVPGEKIDVNVETFSRMNTLPVPTFGRANIKNRAYFVPFRTVFRGWNDFITDAPHHNSAMNVEQLSTIITKVPTVTNDTFVSMMTTYQFVYSSGSNASAFGNWDYGMVTVPAASTTYDVVMEGGVKYRFTTVGRQVMKILESLGYKVNWNTKDTTAFSALPLLCWAKVYCDWYFPSVYTNNVDYSMLQMLLNKDTGDNAAPLLSAEVGRILQMCYTCYDSDYFVSAWDTPNQPVTGTYSGFHFNNIDTIGNVYGASNYTINKQNGVTNRGANAINTGDASERFGDLTAPFITGYLGTISGTVVTGGISQYLLDALKGMTDYMKRHQLAGSRAVDRYLARFGKALAPEKLNRSVYLGCQIVPVQIGDVMSTADTANASVGDYSGKGMAYGGNGNFSFSTNEYGMFIVVSTITPATGYYQGIDRTVKHIWKYDFWTPEFDQLGTQPITADELYVSNNGNGNLASAEIHNSIFGFTPRYAEYKVARDQVTGNFRVPTLNGENGLEFSGSSSWHLMRTFTDTDFNGWSTGGESTGPAVENIKHNINFVYSRGDQDQFNRIFFETQEDVDNFILIHNFNIGDYAPMKPLYDSYDFEDKGKEVKVDVNGVKHN